MRTDLDRAICRTRRAAHGRGNRSTCSIDSILGELLSPALLFVLGVRPLLLGQQLRHRGLWRRSPTVKLAHAGAAGEHHWRLDVWNIRERTVCDNHSARQPRRANVAVIDGKVSTQLCGNADLTRCTDRVRVANGTSRILAALRSRAAGYTCAQALTSGLCLTLMP